MADRGLITLLFTLGVVLPACRKDHPLGQEALPAECVPTPPTPLQGWNFQLPAHVLGAAQFNPLDGDEIMFFDLAHGSTSDYKLHRYVIGASHTEVILAGSNLVNQGYSWGTNGHVLLSMYAPDGTRNIFKCTEDGDSLQQVTFTDWNFNPIWSPDAERWAYSDHAAGVSTSWICSATGDTCRVYGRAIGEITEWYSDSSLATILSMTSSFALFNWAIPTDNLHIVHDIPYEQGNMGGPSGLTVLPDGRTALWLQTIGLYKTDLITGVTEKVIGGTCNSQYFVGLDYSPQTNKLITTRITRTPLNDHDLLIATDIVLMNPDGSGQEVLNIPFPE